MEIKGYKFGNYFLDCNKACLFENHQAVEINERSIKLLTLLAEASPKPLSKTELHEALWSNTIVSDWSISRLISDTRIALGDNGNKQRIIKTARGEGFLMPEVEIITSNTSNNIQKLKKPHFITLFIAIIMLTFYWLNRNEEDKLYQAIAKIESFQNNSFTAFKAQANRRNQLTAMIEKRLNIKRERQFELFFQYVSEQMNEEEKFICHQIRAYSDAGLFENNKAILEELDRNPEIYQEIPSAFALAQHLRIWLDKYNKVFKVRTDMCLVYVGVEDGVPYPSQVDNEIKHWLAQRKKVKTN